MHPPDQAARTAVKERLDETVFLEAGAGSGKTTCLVERFVALVESGVAADRIAAITFTEKAAGELADRVRSELQRRSAGSPRCREALQDLDRSAICTLHAFASRILTENPIEAGLPPRITVLDDIGSQLGFESRWETFFDQLLEDPAMERPLRLLLASGATPDHLRQIAVKFGENWDLVAERATGHRTEVAPLDIRRVLAEVDDLTALGRHCTDPSDGLLARLEKFGAWAGDLRRSTEDDDILEQLGKPPGSAVSRTGRQPNWPDINEVRQRVVAIGELVERTRGAVQQDCLYRIAEEIAAFTVAAAEERRRAGELEFHDLLVLARAVLRDPGCGFEVRRRLAQRYPRLLLDEFQDTDPIQIEMAVLIASSDPDAADKEWETIEADPGRLFFVGDPKQSIYRFRRADIATFLRAQRRLGSQGEQLTANFRTGEPILDWVNHTFRGLIQPDGDSQPAYIALDPQRPGPPRGPAVSMLGVQAHPDGVLADGLREAEAVDVAAAVRAAVSGSWSVEDQSTGRWRPAVWSDVAILLPARTSLRALERALEAAGVPYRAETSSLVYGTGEVRDLLMVARAVEDPTDPLAVTAALRCAAFGCGDDDLYDWRHTYGGSWDHQAPRPEAAPLDHVVGEGLAWMSALHRERAWLAPSQVLERIVRERRLLEAAFAHPRPRDLWRRLRFVVDQCRAWEEAGGTTLRDYLAWVRLQAAEGSRVVEAVLPETDDEAVRILTVHGAKGLEFPITVLSGMTTQLAAPRRGVQVRFPPGDGWALRIRSGLETAEFSDQQPIEEQMDRHERIRLLYVAATRARDHLIVSVHRKNGRNGASTAAELFHSAGWDPDLVTPFSPDGAEPGAPAPEPEAVSARAVPSLEEWEREMAAAREAGTRPVAVSATRLAEEAARAAEVEVLAGIHKDARDIDLPPWQKGRYGSAVGRAVHGVLQSIDLRTGAGLAEECAAQAAAEFVFGKEPVIQAFCRSALGSELVRSAAERPHWREVYVGIPQGDRVLEGYIDLLYRADDGLVIVDYKTDSWSSPADLDAKVQRYAPQLAAYREAVAVTTGEPVAGLWLLFLRPEGAVARPVLA